MEFVQWRFAKELGVKQIADAMGITERTVKAYAEHVYAKMGCRGNQGMNLITVTKMLIREGIIILGDNDVT